MNYLALILTGVICFLLGIWFNQKENKRYILVEKNTGMGGYCKEIRYISLYYDSNRIYKEIDPQLEDVNHFFVPLKKNKNYLNRTIFHNIHLDNSVTYDHNGYDPISNRNMKKAFKNAYKYNPKLYNY